MKYHLIKPYLFKVIIILSSLVGLVMTFTGGDSMMTRGWLYFTIQSNCWILIVTCIILVYEILLKKNKVTRIPYLLVVLRYVFTISILLTGLVFNTMLLPEMIARGNGAYALSLSNVTLHIITPAFAVVEYLVQRDDIKNNTKTMLFGLIPPIYYLCFVYILRPFNVIFTAVQTGQDLSAAYYPYYFMNYEINGFFDFDLGSFKIGVIYWTIFLILVVAGLAKGLLIIKNKLNNQSQKKEG